MAVLLNADLSARSIENCTITGKKFEQGTKFKYNIYLPEEYIKEKNLALYVLLEHTKVMSPLLKQLMNEEIIPPGMVIYCSPGTLPASLPGGQNRGMRAEEFDQYGREYSDFLVEELIPRACTKMGVKLSEDPDMHFICGGSSGGMAAWNAVWFRNDYFRRAYLASPTFSAMRGGEEPMVLLRKSEPRPIKLYITAGTEEPDHYFGSSLFAAQNCASALEYAGYDFRYEQFNGEGHSTRRQHPALWRRMMRYLWANWDTEPVRVLNYSIRINRLVFRNSPWQEVQTRIPPKERSLKTAQGTYSFENGNIFLENNGKRRQVASGFGKISALGLSSDLWRLYIADQERRFIYAMSIQPDGTLNNLYKLAPLHLAHDARRLGASDIAVLNDDRVLAATELGVQGIVSFGITDLILPLPDDVPAERLYMEGDTLLVSGGGKTFARKLRRTAGDTEKCVPPSTDGYGEGVDYTRSHLTMH